VRCRGALKAGVNDLFPSEGGSKIIIILTITELLQYDIKNNKKLLKSDFPHLMIFCNVSDHQQGGRKPPQESAQKNF